MGRRNLGGIDARNLWKEEGMRGRKKAQDRRKGSRKLNRMETGKLLKEVGRNDARKRRRNEAAKRRKSKRKQGT